MPAPSDAGGDRKSTESVVDRRNGSGKFVHNGAPLLQKYPYSKTAPISVTMDDAANAAVADITILSKHIAISN
jgi:hypothetical protein